jgi:ribosome recycling factor
MAEESKTTIVNIATLMREAESKMEKALEALSREFSTIRTGRASPALVEAIRVDYYGTSTPLKQLAAINTPEPKLLVIQPWDANALADIEKAVNTADLGLAPMNDGKLIRIAIPELSKERREELTKLVHKQSEEGKISLRTIRHAAKERIEKLFKEKSVTEDAKFDGLDKIQKLTDRYQDKVDELLKAKESELKTI